MSAYDYNKITVLPIIFSCSNNMHIEVAWHQLQWERARAKKNIMQWTASRKKNCTPCSESILLKAAIESTKNWHFSASQCNRLQHLIRSHVRCHFLNINYLITDRIVRLDSIAVNKKCALIPRLKIWIPTTISKHMVTNWSVWPE